MDGLAHFGVAMYECGSSGGMVDGARQIEGYRLRRFFVEGEDRSCSKTIVERCSDYVVDKLCVKKDFLFFSSSSWKFEACSRGKRIEYCSKLHNLAITSARFLF